MKRLREYFVYSLSLGLVFSLCKLVYMGMVEPAAVTWLAILPNISADILAAFMLGLIVLINRKAALIFGYTGIVFYCLSWFYGALFDGFLHIEAFNFAQDALQFRDSFISEVRWWILPAILMLSLLFKISLKQIDELFSCNPQKHQWVIPVIVLLTASSIYVGQSKASESDINLNPVLKLVSQALYMSLTDRAGSTGAIKTSPGSQGFDFNSPFPDLWKSNTITSPVGIRPGDPPLNVIVIQLESTGNRSRYRENALVTPNFNKLMENGIYYPNTYASIILSIKSIFSLVTGHYPSADLMAITETRPNIPMKSIAEYFKEKEYKTALFHGGKFSFYNKLAFLKNRGYGVLYDSTNIPNREQYEKQSWGVDDAAIFEYSKTWITENNKPFFLHLIPILPHHPYNIPSSKKKAFVEETGLDRYHNSLHYEDQLLGELITFLREKGIFKNTLFVLVGDHGEAFQQHKGNYMHSIMLYEENVNVPLLFSYSRFFPKPVVDKRIASIVDVMPTILELTGKDPSSYDGDGKSLLTNYSSRVAYFGTFFKGTTLGLRDQEYKYIYEAASGTSELYNLQNDSEEKVNVAQENLGRVEIYKSKVLAWAAYTKNKINNYRPRVSATEAVNLMELPISFHAQDYGKLQHNKTVDNKTFQISGQTYETPGWGTHTNSVIEIDVSDYEGYILDIKLGRDEEATAMVKGEIHGQIRLDGVIVYESGPIHSYEPPVHIQLPISGNRLSLLTLKGDDGGHGDHADWLEPRLLPPQ
ncbi:MAG: sulfatase-like hydrolase/transferase [Pseudomonadota bacterium]